MKRIILVSVLSICMTACVTTTDIHTCSAPIHGTIQEDAQALVRDASALQSNENILSRDQLIAQAECLRPRVNELYYRMRVEEPEKVQEAQPLFDQLNHYFDELETEK